MQLRMWMIQALLASCGCTSTLQLAAPAVPDKIMPQIQVPQDSPFPQWGRVIIDVVGERAKVSRVDSTTIEEPMHKRHLDAWRSSAFHHTRLLCVSPCVLDLHEGAHTLIFTSLVDDTRTSVGEVVVVSERTTLVRHALGREKPSSSSPWELMLAAGGTMFTAMGAVMIPVGIADLNDPTVKGNPAAGVAMGVAVAAVGIVTAAIGFTLLRSNRAIFQPGTTTQWDL